METCGCVWPHNHRVAARQLPGPLLAVPREKQGSGFVMRKQCPPSIQPTQAALIVTYGTTTRKHYPLDGDLVVFGRAPSCDLALVSPEVAPVHCILQRSRDGWRIRDCCGGRRATRLNGRQIHEETLHDSDVVQIGTFTFEARLPSSPAAPVVDPCLAARLKRLQRSRRSLVRLALLLRKRLRYANPLPPTLAELEQQARCLRDLQRHYEALLKEQVLHRSELEKVERELCDEREAFDLQCLERRIQMEKTEHDLARHQAAQAAERDRVREGGVGERLAELGRLKQDIAGTSPSAPGDKLRAGIESVTDPVR